MATMVTALVNPLGVTEEGNVLFNDALNTFYLRLCGVVKDHLDSERGNPLPPLHWILFTIRSKRSLISTIP